MLVARVIATVEPGGAQLGVIRLIRALRANGVTTRLLVGEATNQGRRLLDDEDLEFELWGAATAASSTGVTRALRPG
jgi:hypothetical protein